MLKSCLKMHLARVKIKNFLHRERGHPTGTPLSLDHFPRSLGPCHIPSKLLLLLILTEKQLKRFKKQKSPTQGKGTPLLSDHNPLQPWPFGSLHMPSTLLMFLILTFYTEHCMVSITTKALKSGLKMQDL